MCSRFLAPLSAAVPEKNPTSPAASFVARDIRRPRVRRPIFRSNRENFKGAPKAGDLADLGPWERAEGGEKTEK